MNSGIPDRKRDRLRGFFGKSAKAPSSASGTTVPGSGTVPPIPTSSPTPPSQPGTLSDQFYTAALQKLEAEERSALQEHVAPNVNDAVQAAYIAANKQKKICEDKRWTGNDKAKKVVLWLDRFKSVGDIVANADPIHVGLPWAGVRVLLEAAVADSHQMTALMSGMDLALCIANRLQAYLVYFQRLPPFFTTDNFRKALVTLYAHLLRFLAEAIRTYTMDTAARKMRALWRTSDLTTFESQCDKLGGRVAVEANNCDRELRASEEIEASKWKEDLGITLRKLDVIESVEQSLDSLHVKVDLSNLLRIQEATYNSSAEEKLSLCLPGTRSEILDNITQWAGRPDGEFIYWLCGKAGTGKSTISRTIAHRFDKQGYLGASFFFKRGEKDRSNADQFFSTIAAQLADLLPDLQVHIATAIDKDSFLCGRGLQEQFQKLLLQPLLSMDGAHLPQYSIVIVIDALDECDRNTDIRMFLKLLAQMKAESKLHLRIFMTSRPELPIQLGFRQLDGSLHQDIILEDVQELTVRQDIRAYFDSEFEKIKEDRLLLRPDDSLPADWPSNDDVQRLVGLATPLFIFASTVCRFVSGSNPQRRLKVILEQHYVAGSSHLAKTYLPILDQQLLEKDEDEQEEIISDFRDVVGTIILVADPLSVVSLASLLYIDQERIHDRLAGLHSVLQVPLSSHDPVRLLHQSFRDFLVDQKRKDREGFWINEAETHMRLTYQCLRLLQEANSLKSDICGVERPGFRRIELTREQITTRIPADIVYACSQWSWHLVRSGAQLYDNDPVHHFLQQHFLHWLEVLSWVGRLANAITCVNDLLSITKGENCREIDAFLVDARQFILDNRLVMELAPLQIYHSALVFSPKKSVIRNVFQAELPSQWSLIPDTPSRWNGEMLKFEGHHASFNSIAFSPDSRILASVSGDQVLRLWDVASGEERHKLKASQSSGVLAFSADGQIVTLASWYDEPETIEARAQAWNTQTGKHIQDSRNPTRQDVDIFEAKALSEDGHLVAIAMYSWIIQLFDTRTGKQTRCLEDHLSPIIALAFSPDGQNVASGSADGTIQLWDVGSSVPLHKLKRHDSPVTSIVFTPSGRTFASASADGTVLLWDAQAVKQTVTLEGHKDDIATVSFSHDEKMLISASFDRTVRLWDVQTGEQIFQFEPSEAIDDSWSPKAAISPREKIVAVVMLDSEVHLWSPETGEHVQKMEGHKAAIRAVVFSPDGEMIASASADNTVRLWSAKTREQMRTLIEHDSAVLTVVFSPDSQIIASASTDKRVRLWDVKTGEQTQMLVGHDSSVIAVAFSTDRQLAVSASLDKTVRLWNVQTGEQIHKFEALIYQDCILAFASDGGTIVSQSGGDVRFWNIQSGEEVVRSGQQHEEITTSVFSPNCQVLALGSDIGALRLCSVEGGERMRKLRGHDSEIKAIAFSPGGQTLATASYDETVRLWDTETGEQTLQFVWHSEGEQGEWHSSVMSFSPDGRVLALTNQRVVQLWNVQTGQELQRLKALDYGSEAIAFSPDGQALAVSRDRTMQLWNIQTGELMQEFQGHKDSIRAIVFSPNGRVVASASIDMTVRLWDIRHSDKTQQLEGRDQQVTAVCFSPDGGLAASASRDRTLRLWNPKFGKEVLRIQMHDNEEASMIAFSPDGNSIASAASKTIRLWSTHTGAQISTLEANYWVQAMAFSPDGQVLASISNEELHLWNVKTGQLTRHKSAECARRYGVSAKVSFSPDGQLIAYSISGGNLRLVQSRTGKEVWAFEQDEFVYASAAVTFSPDSQTVACISSFPQLSLRVWKVQNGVLVQSLDLPVLERGLNFDAMDSHQSLKVAFEDGKHLRTNVGTFTLEWTPAGSLVRPLKRTTALELDGSWIRYEDQDILYLPYDYRGECLGIHENTLVIGQASGAVSFFRIK